MKSRAAFILILSCIAAALAACNPMNSTNSQGAGNQPPYFSQSDGGGGGGGSGY